MNLFTGREHEISKLGSNAPTKQYPTNPPNWLLTPKTDYWRQEDHTPNTPLNTRIRQFMVGRREVG